MIWAITHLSAAAAVNSSWSSIIWKWYTPHTFSSTAGHPTVEMFHALPLAAFLWHALINNASQFPAYSNRLRDALKWTRLTLNFVDIISSWHLNSLSLRLQEPPAGENRFSELLKTCFHLVRPGHFRPALKSTRRESLAPSSAELLADDSGLPPWHLSVVLNADVTASPDKPLSDQVLKRKSTHFVISYLPEMTLFCET